MNDLYNILLEVYCILCIEVYKMVDYLLHYHFSVYIDNGLSCALWKRYMYQQL